MADVKVQHVLTLAHLLSRGARHNFVTVTTAELGRAISKSQQSASKHLLELEKGGLVDRLPSGRNYSVRITDKGYAEMTRLSGILSACLDSSSSPLVLGGRLVSGMGEGAYYMSLGGYTKQFEAKIGYVPFPGTLNVKLDGKEHVEAVGRLDAAGGIRIDGFSDGTRTYGWVACLPCTVNGADSHLIRPERTHHDTSIIELISRHDLRKHARLQDGHKVTIKVNA